MRELILTRDVTREECGWLDADLSKGTRVFAYRGVTYGCVSDWGTAVTMVPDETPFFEVPDSALAPYEPDTTKAASE